MKNSRFAIRATAGALALAFCLALLCGCAKVPDTKSSDIRFSDIYINGIKISRFVAVIPEKATNFEKWTAQMLTDEIYSLCGEKISVVKDSEKKQNHEILIGNTNREESSLFTPEENTYSVYRRLNKLVILGKDFYVAAGAGHIVDLISESDVPIGGEARLEIKSEAVSYKVEWKKAESAFLFIGDGMGENHVNLATDKSAQVLYGGNVTNHPDEAPLSVFTPTLFENKGYSITLNLQGRTTDSAAGATALATGKKTLNAALGMVPADLDSDGVEDEFATAQNVREKAALSKRSTAVLSTDKYTGATPCAFLIHHSSRKDRSIVLEQQKALEDTPLACTYLWCSYDSDELFSNFKSALQKCQKNEKGFLLVTEEAMIDKYAEKMDYDNVIRTVKRLDKVTAYAATYAMFYKDCVVIVTADHETGGLTKAEDGVWQWSADGEHTGTNVPVYAMGQGSEIFSDSVCENTAIGKFLFKIVGDK